MKARLFLPVTALACLASVALTPLTAAGELLGNGSFENDLDGWKAPASAATVENVQSAAAEGEHVLKIVVPAERTMAVSQELSGLEPGRKYVVSAKVRKNSVEDGRFIVRNVQTAKYLVSRQLAGDEDWNLLEMSFVAPPEGDIACIEFNFRSPGSCEIDEVTVTPAP